MAGEAGARATTRASRWTPGPSSLTVTFGFGHSFFAPYGPGRSSARPRSTRCPTSPPTRSTPKRSNGDLWVQIGADDALVAFHALRALQKEAAGTARVRWQMNGFNRTPGRHRAAR